MYQKVISNRGQEAFPALEVQGDLRLNRYLPGRPTGFNAIPHRLELREDFAASGLVQLNAVTDAPAGNTYNTAATIAMYTANKNFELLGSNAVSADVTRNAEGWQDFATHGGGTDSAILVPHLNSEQSPFTTNTWGTDQETIAEWDIMTGASIGNNVVIYAKLGLTNVGVVATDNDKVMFRYTSGNSSGQWECIYSIGDVDTTIASGVTVAASTRYHLKIVIDDSRIPYFYITVGNPSTNASKLVATGTALTDATDFIPYCGILEASAAAKHLLIGSFAISRNRA